MKNLFFFTLAFNKFYRFLPVKHRMQKVVINFNSYLLQNMKFRKNIHCKAGLKSLKLFICTSRAEKIIRGLYFNFAFLIASFLFIFLCYYISYLYNKNNIYLYPTVGNVNKNTVKYIQYKHIYY
ncbi:hypothetical protein FF38_03665, partial [Lucilia cuprina]